MHTQAEPASAGHRWALPDPRGVKHLGPFLLLPLVPSPAPRVLCRKPREPDILQVLGQQLQRRDRRRVCDMLFLLMPAGHISSKVVDF